MVPLVAISRKSSSYSANPSAHDPRTQERRNARTFSPLELRELLWLRHVVVRRLLVLALGDGRLGVGDLCGGERVGVHGGVRGGVERGMRPGTPHAPSVPRYHRGFPPPARVMTKHRASPPSSRRRPCAEANLQNVGLGACRATKRAPVSYTHLRAHETRMVI